METSLETSYYIFKTDFATGKTVHVCNGSHDSEEQCRIHWQSYMYGFMDAGFEYNLNLNMSEGSRKLSFIADNGSKRVEYFMLLGKEGQDLVYKLASE